MLKQKPALIDLSILTIIKFVVVILALVFIFIVRDIIAILFVALVLSAAISPAVNFFYRKNIPRNVSVIVLLILFFSFIGFLLYLLIPAIMTQFSQLSVNLPQYLEKFDSINTRINNFAFNELKFENFQQALNTLGQSVPASFNSIFQSIFDFLGGVVSFLVVIVVTFYLLAEEEAIKRGARLVLPEKYSMFVFDILKKIQVKISDWLKGQIALSGIIGLLVYMGLLILGVEYALILALMAFVGEFIPYLGPILAAIPAIIIAFIESPILGLFTLILFVVIQQAENHILVPKIMQRAVGLNPVVSIVALLIGAKLAGVIGVVLAIPVTTAIIVVIKEIFIFKERQSSEN